MDNERPIEKLLRAWAKKRRDDAGAPLEMHPATRRMLQGEASRQFPKKAADGARTFWQRLTVPRPRLVYALCVLALVAVGTSLLLPRSNRTQRGAQPTSAAGAGRRDLAAKAPVNPPPIKVQGTDTAWLVESAAPAAKRTSDLAVNYQTVARTDVPTTPPAVQRDRAEIKTKAESAVAFNLAEREVPLLAGTPSAGAGSATRQLAPRVGFGRDAAVDEQAQKSIPTASDDLAAVALDVPREEPERRPAMEFKAGTGGVPPAGGETTIAKSVRGQLAKDGAGLVSESLGSRSLGLVPAAAPLASSQLKKMSEGTAANEDDTPRGGAIMQRFVRSDAADRLAQTVRADRIASPAPVLASFQIEQTGNQLRVIDSDGSVYTGSVESVSAPLAVTAAGQPKTPAQMQSGGGGGGAGQESGALKAAVAQPAEPPFTQPVYNFRVSGTNRTLQQPVEFAWNYVSVTNGTGTIRTLTLADQGQLKDQSGADRKGLSTLQPGISGRLRLGQAQAADIQAVPR